MPATKNLPIEQRGPGAGPRYDLPVAGARKIFAGTIVGMSDNTAAPASLIGALPVGTAGCVCAVGIALDPADGRTKGARVLVGTGVFNLKHMFATTPTTPKIKAPVYATSDNALTMTAGANTLLLGTLDAIDTEGVWVRI